MPLHDDSRRHARNNMALIILGSIVGILLLLALGVFLNKGGGKHLQAKRAALMIQDLGGHVSWNPELLETIIRDGALSRITDVHFTNPTFSEEKWLVLNELPQHFGLQVKGPQVSDASLEYLKEVELLKYLVLSDTRVTNEGVAALIKSLPGVTVMFDYPGDPNFRQFNSHAVPVTQSMIKN